MPTVNIEGVGRVTVDDTFTDQSPEMQDSIVKDIVQKLKTKDVSNELAYRSTILPLGKTKGGNIVPAVPGMIKSLYDAPAALIDAAKAGPPGSRELTEAAIAPAAEVGLSMGPTSAGGKVARAILKKPDIPITEELHAAATQDYNTVKQSGAQIKPEPFAQMVVDMAQELKTAGFDKDLQTKAVVPVRRLAEAAASRKETGQPISFEEFDTLRKMAQDAADSASADDRRIGGMIKGHMDDFLASLAAKDVTGGGDPQLIAAALKRARSGWARYSRSNEIDQLFERAQNNTGTYNAAGFENALRVEFKKLANSERRMRRFSDDEKDAIRAVARGSKLQEAFTKLGKFSPTAGFFGTLFGVGSAEMVLHGASNPELLGLAGIGAVAKYAATKLRKNTAEGAQKIVRGGAEAAAYLKQKSAVRQKTVRERRELGAAAGIMGAEGDRQRITIPLDPKNVIGNTTF